jgi:hypothetical protein
LIYGSLGLYYTTKKEANSPTFFLCLILGLEEVTSVVMKGIISSTKKKERWSHLFLVKYQKREMRLKAADAGPELSESIGSAHQESDVRVSSSLPW